MGDARGVRAPRTSGPIVPRRATVGVGLVFVMLGAAVSSYGPALPELRHRFGVDIGTSGLVVSAHFAGSVVGVLIADVLDTRWSTRRSTVSAVVLFGMGCAIAVVAPVWPLLLAGAVIIGLGFGVLAVVLNTHGAAGYGERGGAMVSLFTALFCLGALCGPVVIGALPSRGLTPVLGFCAVVAAAIVVPLMALPAFAGESGRGTSRGAWRDRRITAAFVVVMFFYAGCQDGISTWEATHLVGIGVGAGIAAAATSLYWAGVGGGRVVSAMLVHRIPPARYLTVSYGAAIGVLLLAEVSPVAWIAYAVVGALIGPVFPVVVVWASRMVSRPGRVVSGMMLGASLGGTILPALLGRAVAATTVEVIPVGIALCAGASLGVALLTAARVGVAPHTDM